MGKDSLFLWEGGGPKFSGSKMILRMIWIIWFGGWVVMSWVKTISAKQNSQAWEAPKSAPGHFGVVASGAAAPCWSRFGKVMWFDISAPRSWTWWGDGIFKLKNVYNWCEKRGSTSPLGGWGVVGVVSRVDKNAEEEVLKPLLSRAAWELVQELWGGWVFWSLAIFLVNPPLSQQQSPPGLLHY